MSTTSVSPRGQVTAESEDLVGSAAAQEVVGRQLSVDGDVDAQSVVDSGDGKPLTGSPDDRFPLRLPMSVHRHRCGCTRDGDQQIRGRRR